MSAALMLFAAALAEDLAGAPGQAQAALGGLFAFGFIVLAWGAVLCSCERVERKRWRAAQRLSRCLFAAAGVKRRYRLP